MSWEYKIVQPEMKGLSGLSSKKIHAASEDILNKMGREGWECYHVNVDAYPSVFYLKRPR
ncbi:MAG: DUF4177 domain-containing protein [Pseudomonadota bacterium]